VGNKKFIVLAGAVLVFLETAHVFAYSPFVRGDANGDGLVSVADADCIADYLYNGGPEPLCVPAANAYPDTTINVFDLFEVLAQVIGISNIPAEDRVPPAYRLSRCSPDLAATPLLDTGVWVSLDDVVASGRDIAVPLRVWGRTGKLHAWCLTVTYPPESLEFVRMAPAYTSRQPDVFMPNDIAPGTVRLMVFYAIEQREENCYSVSNGTKIADIVFRRRGQDATAAVNIAGSHGAAELTFGPEATFPAVAGGTVFLTGGVPAPPSNLAVESDENQVHLSWENGAAYQAVFIERDGATLAVLDGQTRAFDDAAPSGELTYRVRGYQGGVRSPGAFAPVARWSVPPPENLITRENQHGQLVLQWKNGGAYDALRVCRNGALLAELPGSDTNFVIADQPPVIVVYSVCGLVAHDRSRFASIATGPSAAGGPFVRGDANWDGTVSLMDVVYTRRYLFFDGESPWCPDAADATDDGVIDIEDVLHTLSVIYFGWRNGPAMIFPEPYPVPGTDPTPDDLLCTDRDITPGQPTGDLVRVGNVEAAPGQEVSIPIFLSNSVSIQGFQLVIGYNPSIFTPDGDDCSATVGCTGLDFSNTAYGKPPDVAVLDVHASEGYFVVAAVFNFRADEEAFLPPAEDQLLLEIAGTVAPDAPSTAVVELVPTNGPDDEGVGIHRLRNEITGAGEARYITIYPQRETGILNIKDNPVTMDFLRGDVNLDAEVNIADAAKLLAFLFANGAAPLCREAADVNDDRSINIADVTTLLGFLFNTASVQSLPRGFGVCYPGCATHSLGCGSNPFCR
jgi:hypothetical protein